MECCIMSVWTALISTNVARVMFQIVKYNWVSTELAMFIISCNNFITKMISRTYYDDAACKIYLVVTKKTEVLVYISEDKIPLQWLRNERDGLSNHQPHDCLLDRLFRCRSKKTSKLRVDSLCAGNSLVTGEFLAQRASNTENVSIWWRHHVIMWETMSGCIKPLTTAIFKVTFPKLIRYLTAPADYLDARATKFHILEISYQLG